MSGAVTTIPLPRLRRTLLLVAGLNLAYFGVEAAVALAIGSVALLADSVDFLEDTAVNLLIVLALGWSLRARSRAGKVLALVILLPAVAAAWQIFTKVGNPEPPQPVPLMITAGGAVVVNAVAALILLRVRRHGGSLTHGAWLAARNDVAVNLAIIAMGLLTAATGSGWPDIVLGAAIIALNATAAREVWRIAESERVAERALAGEDVEDDGD
jgi:Co/Zn/Cd efflux system component